MATQNNDAGDHPLRPRPGGISEHAVAQLGLERNLYWRLLELGARDDDLVPFLEEALSLIVEVTGAKKGYLALYDPNDASDQPRWSITRGCSEEEVKEIRQKISRGIIAEAMATGQTIHTGSALEDPRFSENKSVQKLSIREVLCAPVGRKTPIGVLYLQERESALPFTEEDKQRAEAFARHLAPFVDRLMGQERLSAQGDPTLPVRQRLKLEGLVGKSRALAAVLQQIENASKYEIGVLLRGPSGTGKTALARAIHDNGPRAGKPFVELNCATVPENLFESELFGAHPGAHSTATKKIPGKLAAAQGGTLFLDEIGELTLALQSKFLQFLQSKEYFPLGSTKPERADVRVIAATNADFEDAVRRKAFREDLFYRLNVMPIKVPSLSERREDATVLAQHFCQEARRKHGLPPLSLSLGALWAVEVADWPGNVRQLSHAIEAAAIRAAVEGNCEIEAHHLFPEEQRDPAEGKPLLFQEATRRFQKKLLVDTLEATQWNISETARKLGLTRSHIHNLLQAFELRRAEKRPKG
jgi:Nif-specific regulatory protein